jgi:DNA-directed RNA polymerase specialized sigma24 family protein
MSDRTLARPENRAYAALLEARSATGGLWPEPQTTVLYKRLVQGCYAIAGSLFGRKTPDVPEQAREIASHVLLHLGEFQGDSQFSTWFYAVARREFIRVAKEQKARSEVPLDELNEPIVRPHGGKLSLPNTFSEGDKLFIRLVVLGYSFSEIGAILNRSKNEVYYEWTLLRERLKHLLESSPTL